MHPEKHTFFKPSKNQAQRRVIGKSVGKAIGGGRGSGGGERLDQQLSMKERVNELV